MQQDLKGKGHKYRLLLASQPWQALFWRRYTVTDHAMNQINIYAQRKYERRRVYRTLFYLALYQSQTSPGQILRPSKARSIVNSHRSLIFFALGTFKKVTQTARSVHIYGTLIRGLELIDGLELISTRQAKPNVAAVPRVRVPLQHTNSLALAHRYLCVVLGARFKKKCMEFGIYHT